MRVREITLDWTNWTVKKYRAGDGSDWVSIRQPGPDGSDNVLVWAGPIHLWIELRVMFNELMRYVDTPSIPLAFPAHYHEMDIPNDLNDPFGGLD